jgi:hypothetical protein
MWVASGRGQRRRDELTIERHRVSAQIEPTQ